MLEVVFSDSVAGAMLVAIGHQHSIAPAPPFDILT